MCGAGSMCAPSNNSRCGPCRLRRSTHAPIPPPLINTECLTPGTNYPGRKVGTTVAVLRPAVAAVVMLAGVPVLVLRSQDKRSHISQDCNRSHSRPQNNHSHGGRNQ
jgi:hypothetical protein